LYLIVSIFVTNYFFPNSIVLVFASSYNTRNNTFRCQFFRSVDEIVSFYNIPSIERKNCSFDKMLQKPISLFYSHFLVTTSKKIKYLYFVKYKVNYRMQIIFVFISLLSLLPSLHFCLPTVFVGCIQLH